MSTQPSKDLETFPNPQPETDYTIRIRIPEFTCLCPKTGQPDFAHLQLEYVPDESCVELKSWKLYLWSYRDEGAFHEAVTNRILDDLVAASDLVVTKPGGMIASEVLARGTPMIVVDPIPGQEEWNADWIALSGAGMQIRRPEMVPDAVRDCVAGRCVGGGRLRNRYVAVVRPWVLFLRPHPD